MKVVTARQMRDMDRRTIEEYCIPGMILMENAGLGVVTTMIERFSGLTGWDVLVVCGKGNNGGDGFVVARRLRGMGVSVRTVLLCEAGQLKGDAALNCRIALKTGIEVEEITGQGGLGGLLEMLGGCDIVVDAMLGTGLTAGVEGYFGEVIRAINGSGKPVVSVDIPSGLSSDSGEIPGEHVNAQLTVTFALPKIGQLIYPAADSVGELVVVDIGIPPEVVAGEVVKVNLLDDKLLAGLLDHRLPDTHKGTYGHLMVVAGSTGKMGAGILAARAALRSGAGLVTLAVPQRFCTAVDTALVEVMTLPLPETKKGTVAAEAAPLVMEAMEDKDALVIGPGLTTDASTRDFVLEIIDKCHGPTLVDADGCNNLAGELHRLKKCKAPLVLTPHPGEMSRLKGISVAEVEKDRIHTVQDFAASNNVCLALKGARTLVCDPEGEVFINPTGNPAMATAGMGDVLSGMIGSFLAQGLNRRDAANLGVYLHGRCGDMAADEIGRVGILAGDLLDLIPGALEELKGNDGV